MEREGGAGGEGMSAKSASGLMTISSYRRKIRTIYLYLYYLTDWMAD